MLEQMEIGRTVRQHIAALITAQKEIVFKSQVKTAIQSKMYIKLNVNQPSVKSVL